MSGVQIELPELWVIELARADARFGATLSALGQERTVETKRAHAVACREFAAVLRALPYSADMPNGLGWALRHHAVEGLESDARDAEQWAESMQDAGEW